MAADPLSSLLRLRELPARRVAGLMSGTSADGIDVAVVEIRGWGRATKVELLAFDTVPIETDFKEHIWNLPDGPALTLCELNFLLGEAFAQAVEHVVEEAGLRLEDLHLIGSHGQTARHQPPGEGTIPSTLQIGEGAVIAERTGVPVICDFRVGDVAAGGQGAPLIPLVDHLLFQQPDRILALLNLGGIANITVLTPRAEEIIAFDTGPANMTLDAVARATSDGLWAYDLDGQLAASGAVDQAVLAELLALPYFARRPPKSTGRELFGRDLVNPLLDRFDARPADLLSTLTQLTVESVGRALDDFVLPQHGVAQVYVSGGGVHNVELMQRLTRRLAPIPVDSLAVAGMDPDAKEAVGFAVLANETLFCRPGNLPSATGAEGPRVLGKIVLPPL